jgi:hypothetical protein
MNRLVHPLLESRVELLGLGREDQHVAIGQPHMLGPGRRGDRRVEGAVGRSQRHARDRQDFRVPTPCHQHRGNTRPGQQCAQAAADRTGTNDHVSVVVPRGQCLFQCRTFYRFWAFPLLSDVTHHSICGVGTEHRLYVIVGHRRSG